MFDFLFKQQKSVDVKRLLTGRLNQIALQRLKEDSRRRNRSTWNEVVWLTLGDERGTPLFETTVPVLTRDLSEQGISLTHREPLAGRVFVGLRQGDTAKWFACEVRHCTPLGFGFYQLGLFPESVCELGAGQLERLDQRLQQIRAVQVAGLRTQAV